MLTSHKMKEGKCTFNYFENYHKMIKIQISLSPLCLHMFNFGNLPPSVIQSVTSLPSPCTPTTATSHKNSKVCNFKVSYLPVVICPCQGFPQMLRTWRGCSSSIGRGVLKFDEGELESIHGGAWRA